MKEDVEGTDADVAEMYRELYIRHYESRDIHKFGLAQEAIAIFLHTIHAVDAAVLHTYFSTLSDKINMEMRRKTPDLRKSRLWISGWNAYFQAVNAKGQSCLMSLKDEVIEQLERNLPRHLGSGDLLSLAIVQELDCCAIFETMSSPQPRYPYWGKIGPGPNQQIQSNDSC